METLTFWSLRTDDLDQNAGLQGFTRLPLLYHNIYDTFWKGISWRHCIVSTIIITISPTPNLQNCFPSRGSRLIVCLTCSLCLWSMCFQVQVQVQFYCHTYPYRYRYNEMLVPGALLSLITQRHGHSDRQECGHTYHAGHTRQVPTTTIPYSVQFKHACFTSLSNLTTWAK
jgi:hypothetical protein